MRTRLHPSLLLGVGAIMTSVGQVSDASAATFVQASFVASAETPSVNGQAEVNSSLIVSGAFRGSASAYNSFPAEPAIINSFDLYHYAADKVVYFDSDGGFSYASVYGQPMTGRLDVGDFRSAVSAQAATNHLYYSHAGVDLALYTVPDERAAAMELIISSLATGPITLAQQEIFLGQPAGASTPQYATVNFTVGPTGGSIYLVGQAFNDDASAAATGTTAFHFELVSLDTGLVVAQAGADVNRPFYNANSLLGGTYEARFGYASNGLNATDPESGQLLEFTPRIDSAFRLFGAGSHSSTGQNPLLLGIWLEIYDNEPVGGGDPPAPVPEPGLLLAGALGALAMACRTRTCA